VFSSAAANVTLGGRDPDALGRPHAQVFPEAWVGDELPALLRQVMTGRPTSTRSVFLPRPGDWADRPLREGPDPRRRVAITNALRRSCDRHPNGRRVLHRPAGAAVRVASPGLNL
jgi:hypothetical protein